MKIEVSIVTKIVCMNLMGPGEQNKLQVCATSNDEEVGDNTRDIPPQPCSFSVYLTDDEWFQVRPGNAHTGLKCGYAILLNR